MSRGRRYALAELDCVERACGTAERSVAMQRRDTMQALMAHGQEWIDRQNEMLRKAGRDKNMLFTTRIDAVYGLVRLMDDAAEAAGKIKPPVAFLYGQKDKIVPRDAAFTAASRLPADARTASCSFAPNPSAAVFSIKP